jgi:hypothetical protein
LLSSQKTPTKPRTRTRTRRRPSTDFLNRLSCHDTWLRDIGGAVCAAWKRAFRIHELRQYKCQ